MEKIKGAEKRTVSFKYDPFGRRIEKKFEQTVDGVTKTETTSYVYDNDDIAVEIYTDANSNTEKTFFTHGPGVDEHLALDRNGSYYYYHADGLGSIVSITDTSRNVVQSYEYDSYGMLKPSTNFRNSYAYTGREWDKETGTYHYRKRTYDPMDGRFISKDPIGFAGGDVNLFGYVQNNPLNFVDPSGLCPCGNPSDVIAAARSDKRDWSREADRTDVNSGFSKGTNKCNLFVDTQYEEAGYNLPNIGGSLLSRIMGKYPPGAQSLSNSNYSVPGWPVVTGEPIPGDLIAEQGHVGIVTGPGTSISASPSGVLENNWGFRNGQTPVIRRCRCPEPKTVDFTGP